MLKYTSGVLLLSFGLKVNSVASVNFFFGGGGGVKLTTII